MHCPPLAPAARSYVFPFAVQADGDQRVVIKESGLTLRVPDLPCAVRALQQPRRAVGSRATHPGALPGLVCRVLCSGSLSLPVPPSLLPALCNFRNSCFDACQSYLCFNTFQK